MAAKQKVVTVRMDSELHERLKRQVMLERVRRGEPDLSMNKFCIEAVVDHVEAAAKAAMDEFDQVGSL